MTNKKIWLILPLALATLIIFGLMVIVVPTPAGAVANTSLLAGPAISIDQKIPVRQNTIVTIPVRFAANGTSISSIIFSIDYDQTWLEFDPTVPASITLSLPNGFVGSCTPNTSDPFAEINCFLYDPVPPLAALPDGTLGSIKLRTKNAPGGTEAKVGFSVSNPTSFGNTSGAAEVGNAVDGSVLFTDGTTPPPPFKGRVFLPILKRDTVTVTPPTVTVTPPTVTVTPPTVTVTPPTVTPPPGCANYHLQNRTFEPSGGYWYLPATVKTAWYTTYRAHSPNYSVYTGIDAAHQPGINLESYSSVRSNSDLTFTIPSNALSATLKFWQYSISTGLTNQPQTLPMQVVPEEGKPLELSSTSSDVQYVLVLDFFNNIYGSPVWELENTNGWLYREVSITPWIGRAIKLQFGTYNNGYGGIASMYIDDVMLDVCMP